MSDTGQLIKPIASENPTPQLPDTVSMGSTPKVQPGSVAPAPNMPALNTPNVNGGAASFSDVTGAIQQFVAAKTAELSASQNALVANTQVDQNAAQQIHVLQNTTLQTFDNIQKAEQLPGGAGGKLAKIVGLFNSDYNMEKQKTQLEITQYKSKMITDTAQAIKEGNNALPAILAKVSEASNMVFQAQKDANQLAINAETLKDKQFNTQLSASRLRIEMSQEQRAAADFKIKSMTSAQLQAELPRANAGKGPLAGLGGLIEEHLTAEESAQTTLATAQLALKKGNRQEYEDSMATFVGHLPVDLSTQMLQKAQAAGAPVVSFPTGEIDPATKKPATMDIPIDIVQKGITANLDTQTKVTQALAADIAQTTNLVPTITNLSNSAAAFASVDPRATQIMTQLGSILQNTDMKNPQAIKQTSLLVNNLKTSFDGIVKEQANKYSTPDAKAAIINYGNTGKFDAIGGTSVAAASVGVPSVNAQSLYKSAWTEYSTQVATQIAAEHNNGRVGGAAMGDTNADVMQTLASMMQGNQGREKLTQIGQNVLADPTKAKSIGAKITAAAQGKIFNDVLLGLGQGKDAPPIFKDLYEHTEQIVDKNNQLDFGKIATRLEMQTVTSGGKINYGAMFLKGIQNYGANAENNSASDPSYTLQDHALEAAIFGANPYRAISADIYRRTSAAANKAHQEMQARIQSDLSGKTVNAAIMHADPLFEPYPGEVLPDGSFKPDVVLKRTGVNVAAVPSATGTGLTVLQIKQLYGGNQ